MTSREIKIKKKDADVEGLQIADLVAHPTRQEILVQQGRIQQNAVSPFSQQIVAAIQQRWDARYCRVFLT